MKQALGLLLAAAGVCGTPAAAQRLAYEGALSAASGTYFFTERTTGWMLASGLALTAGRFGVRATLPLYVQNTTLVSGTGGGMMPTGGSLGGMVSDSGAARRRRGGGGMHLPVPAAARTGYEAALGDPLVQVSWRAAEGATAVTVGAAVKIPVTDTSDFGTGAWDVGSSFGITRALGATGFAGLDVSYWHLGDLPDLDLLDQVTVSTSLGRRFGTRLAGAVSFSAATSGIRGYPGPVSVGLTAARLGTVGWSVSASVGLSESAPDVALALGWRYSP